MRKIINAVVFIVCLIPQIIFADFGLDVFERVIVFDQLNNSFGARLSFLHLHYMEDAAEGVPGGVKDIGIMYGVLVDAKNVFWKKLYTELSGEYVAGKIKYDGFEDNKEKGYPPVDFKFQSSVISIDGKSGFILVDSNFFQLIPYVGLGFHYWGRDTAKDINYRYFKWLLGGKMHFAFTENFILSPYACFGKIFVGGVKPKVGDGSKANHNLGHNSLYEVGLEVSYRMDKEIFLIFGTSYTHFSYQKSKDIINSYISNEQDSRTNEIRLNLGVRFGFK